MKPLRANVPVLGPDEADYRHEFSRAANRLALSSAYTIAVSAAAVFGGIELDGMDPWGRPRLLDRRGENDVLGVLHGESPIGLVLVCPLLATLVARQAIARDIWLPTGKRRVFD